MSFSRPPTQPQGGAPSQESSPIATQPSGGLPLLMSSLSQLTQQQQQQHPPAGPNGQHPNGPSSQNSQLQHSQPLAGQPQPGQTAQTAAGPAGQQPHPGHAFGHSGPLPQAPSQLGQLGAAAVAAHTLKTYYGTIPASAKDERRAARDRFNKELAQIIIDLKPTLVVCAGWMLILSPIFLTPLEQQNIDIINLHPALPGAFPGIHAIQRAWEAGQRGEITKGGLMIHYVIAAVDEGKPILVREIELKKDETVEQYEERVHAVEHEAIVEGTKKALASRIHKGI